MCVWTTCFRRKSYNQYTLLPQALPEAEKLGYRCLMVLLYTWEVQDNIWTYYINLAFCNIIPTFMYIVCHECHWNDDDNDWFNVFANAEPVSKCSVPWKFEINQNDWEKRETKPLLLWYYRESLYLYWNKITVVYKLPLTVMKLLLEWVPYSRLCKQNIIKINVDKGSNCTIQFVLICFVPYNSITSHP